jgi:hypothetical protein
MSDPRKPGCSIQEKVTVTRRTDDRGRSALGPEYANQQVTLTIERAIDVQETPVFRVVHFLGFPDHVKAQLYAGSDHPNPDVEAVYGIDWGTGPIWNEQPYAAITENTDKKALSDYNRMNEATDGGLVAAYYGARANTRNDDDHEDEYNLDDYLVIGITPPEATVRAFPYPRSTDPDATIGFLKGLPLVNTVEVSREEYPNLFEGHIAGHSIYRTTEKESLIRRVYNDLQG